MDENSFMRPTQRLSPYLTELPISDLDEGLKTNILPVQIAVSLKGCNRSVWSVTLESSADRNSVIFPLAGGKYKSEKKLPLENVEVHYCSRRVYISRSCSSNIVW
ncbi:hypothetical protein M758_UG154600 [Ceratodon purpureus]|nr:hypothetical protein M758_UG154600 [Ceratodon purpureus]